MIEQKGKLTILTCPSCRWTAGASPDYLGLLLFCYQLHLLHQCAIRFQPESASGSVLLGNLRFIS